MFDIDKKKFGAFVSELRKEKGYTQKELAEKLFISDKAISKWETAVSIPDTALLVPLAELLGVTVTELLMSERIKTNAAMDADRVEDVVKTALTYSEEKTMRAYRIKSRWKMVYICAAIVGVSVTVLSCLLRGCCSVLITSVCLGTVLGAYFCFLVKTKLPAYYDENRCGLYYDGAFRMNVPGVAFNNKNWPYIVQTGRSWSCLFAAIYPVFDFALHYCSTKLWPRIELYVFLAFLLGGLFVPMYIIGRKYE